MKHKIIFVTIIIIAFFLRFYKLGSLPNAYSPDELAQGYTAYSILHTGKDEWGNQNWFNLRSFGDYKPPIQTLLMIPSIYLFGLNPFAVRFPNAFFSLLTIVITYLIAEKLFTNKKISLFSALFMAISPWALPLSRIALEANLVIFFISLGLYFFLLAAEHKKNIFYILSALFFGISLFTYHSAKIFSPIFLILLVIFKKTYQKPKKLILPIAIFTFFLVTNFWLNSQIKSDRTGDIAIFNPTDKWAYVSNSQFEITQNGLPYTLTKIFYNKITYLYETFTNSYLSYFSPQFLLTQGAGETTYGMIPGYGVLGLIPFLGFILSLVLLIQKKLSSRSRSLLFLLATILLPPFIAAIAKGSYSGNRVSLMMPFIQIVSAVGLVSFIENFSKKNQKIVLVLTLIMFFSFSSLFLIRYFYQSNQILSEGMLYGHREANEYIKSHPTQTIIYSRKLSEPQAYVSFFQQINPKNTQKESLNWLKYQSDKLSFLDQLGEYKLNNFIFKEINIPSDSQLSNTLIIGRPEEFRNVKPDYIIYYPSKSEKKAAIYILDTSHAN